MLMYCSGTSEAPATVPQVVQNGPECFQAVMRNICLCGHCCSCLTILLSEADKCPYCHSLSNLYATKCVQTFWSPRPNTWQVPETLKNTGDSYTFVDSHCRPLQKQKECLLCLFLKSNHCCWMKSFSKGQGDSVQRGNMCNSSSPKLNSCRWKVGCPAQCKRIYTSWKERWRTCRRPWRNVKSNCRCILCKYK